MARLYGPGPGDPPPLVSTHDLAGLSTNDVDNRPIGELFGTLSDEMSGLIRYLDVALRDAPRHVLVPIGHARIQRDAVPPHVRLRAATFEDLQRVPDFDPERTEPDPTYQDAVMTVHGQLFYGSRYYAHPAFDHRALYAGEHPVIGPEAGDAFEPLIRPLSELSAYRVARGEPDIRGWRLEDSHGERVGTVADLLVELAPRKVRYVVVELDDPPRSTALPIGYLKIDQAHERVRTPALTHEDIRLLPPFTPPLRRDLENRIHAALEGRLIGDRYFDRPDFSPAGDGA